jgi:ADP-glucose pyrophosphorylase
MFAPVCEEAATLVLAGEHFIDFCDFDLSEVVFFREAERAPVVVVLKNVSDSVRMQRRNVMRYISDEGISRYTS